MPSKCMEWEEIHNRLLQTSAYPIIGIAYKGKTAKRSGLPYINHINEGVYIFVRKFGWIEDPISAYCVHPVFQTDKQLKRTIAGEIDISQLTSTAIVMAMEYRRVANAYLSTNKVRTSDEIELSPLPSVNQMLAADKIQNKKDFVSKLYKTSNRPAYHRACDRYIQYFDSWLSALGVSPDEYEELSGDLSRTFPDRHNNMLNGSGEHAGI